MLRFIKHNLTGIDGVAIYPIISLMIFVIFFVFVILYVIRMKKVEIDELGALPFQEGDEPEVQLPRERKSRRARKLKGGAILLLLLFLSQGAMAQEGEKLFKAKCNVCHIIGKPSTGPDLTGALQKWIDAGEGEFIYEWVQNPQQLLASGKSKMAALADKLVAGSMTPQDVSKEQIDAIFSYIDNPPPPPVISDTSSVVGGELVIVPNYEKNLTLFYYLIAGIILQLVVIFVIAYSTKSLVEYKSKKDASSGSLKNWVVLIGVLSFIAAGNHSMALNFIEPGEGVEGPWLLVEDFDIYVLLTINFILLLLVLNSRRTFMDIAHIVRPNQTERIPKRRTSRAKKVLTDAVPLEEEHTILMHHEYDGIRELDNNLPPWWVGGFYLTILFALVYLMHYHVLKTGDLQLAEYEKAIATAEAEKNAYLDKMAMNVDENTVTLLTEAGDLNTGKTLFEANCVSCHNPKGEGNNIGPNLSDKNWIYGYNIKDVFTSIKYGRPNGMPDHNTKLNPVQIQQAASYVLSLPPAAGREPQGEIVEK